MLANISYAIYLVNESMNENSLLSSESTIYQMQFLLKGDNHRLSHNESS